MKMPTAEKGFDDLVKLMREKHEVDDHTCCGIVIMLNTKENYDQMSDWLKKNPLARQSEIMRQHLAIINYVPHYKMSDLPKNRKKFAGV